MFTVTVTLPVSPSIALTPTDGLAGGLIVKYFDVTGPSPTLLYGATDTFTNCRMLFVTGYQLARPFICDMLTVCEVDERASFHSFSPSFLPTRSVPPFAPLDRSQRTRSFCARSLFLPLVSADGTFHVAFHDGLLPHVTAGVDRLPTFLVGFLVMLTSAIYHAPANPCIFISLAMSITIVFASSLAL